MKLAVPDAKALKRLLGARRDEAARSHFGREDSSVERCCTALLRELLVPRLFESHRVDDASLVGDRELQHDELLRRRRVKHDVGATLRGCGGQREHVLARNRQITSDAPVGRGLEQRGAWRSDGAEGARRLGGSVSAFQREA